MPERRRIGLVAPLPPQVGGVASVAEWLLAHEREIGCAYEAFDLRRPADGPAGGRLTVRDAVRQAGLLARFMRWLRGSPRVVHYSVSATTTGLARDVVYVRLLGLAGHKVLGHIHIVPESRSAQRLLQMVDRSVSLWVALSPTSMALLAPLGIEATWIPNPVAVAASTTESRPRSGPLRLLFVGQYGKRKGCVELVAALERARAAGVEATLRFVGREEYRGEEEALRREVRERRLSEHVEFAGVVKRSGLAAQFADSDVICLPSKLEGVPVALLEGMASGLPALATPVGGIVDFVQPGENGLLVEPGDVAGLADSIAILAGDPELRGRLGAAARERVRALANEQEIAQRWHDAYAACEEAA